MKIELELVALEEEDIPMALDEAATEDCTPLDASALEDTTAEDCPMLDTEALDAPIAEEAAIDDDTSIEDSPMLDAFALIAVMLDETSTDEDAPLDASSLDKVSIEDTPWYHSAISSRESGSRTSEKSEHETASIMAVRDNSRTFKIESIEGFLEISGLQARTRATSQQHPCLSKYHSSHCARE